MHITEYFVILYSELQEIMKKFKVAYLHHQSILNLEDEATKEASNEDVKESAKESAKEAGKEAGKEVGSKEAGKESEEEINLKEIYRKLLFIFHPDKFISPNEQIFGEIKKAWDDKYEPTIVFYFIKNYHHPMLKIIHEKIYNKKRFLKFLKNLCNMITKEINNIRRTPIWNKYYNLRKI